MKTAILLDTARAGIRAGTPRAIASGGRRFGTCAKGTVDQAQTIEAQLPFPPSGGKQISFDAIAGQSAEAIRSARSILSPQSLIVLSIQHRNVGTGLRLHQLIAGLPHVGIIG